MPSDQDLVGFEGIVVVPEAQLQTVRDLLPAFAAELRLAIGCKNDGECKHIQHDHRRGAEHQIRDGKTLEILE